MRHVITTSEFTSVSEGFVYKNLVRIHVQARQSVFALISHDFKKKLARINMYLKETC